MKAASSAGIFREIPPVAAAEYSTAFFAFRLAVSSVAWDKYLYLVTQNHNQMFYSIME